MTDFKNGDRVTLVCENDDDWHGLAGTVISQPDSPLTQVELDKERPDGFGMTPFFWPKEMLKKDFGPSFTAYMVYHQSADSYHSNPNLPKAVFTDEGQAIEYAESQGGYGLDHDWFVRPVTFYAG